MSRRSERNISILHELWNTEGKSHSKGVVTDENSEIPRHLVTER